ncbi:MAG: hypothetical protein P8X39_07645 [Desulfofustis sp.]
MTATRIKIDGKPVLKLTIHAYDERDIPFLDHLGISEVDSNHADCRYIHIHSKEDFLSIRSAIFERYKVTEKGPKAYLEAK